MCADYIISTFGPKPMVFFDFIPKCFLSVSVKQYQTDGILYAVYKLFCASLV